MHSDLDRIMEMGLRFWKEGPYCEEQVSPDVAKRFASNLLESRSSRILVAEQDGMIIGMVAFIVFPHFFTGQITATEMIWFVEPEFRRISSWPDGSVAIQLLREAENSARSMGAVKMQFTAPRPQVAGLYERFGYTETEVGFQRDISASY